MRFPVICKGIVPNIGSFSGYGEVNVPVQCVGVAVLPGDVIVVDGSGVVVVPQEDAAEILEKAKTYCKPSTLCRRTSKQAQQSVN